MIPVIRRLAAKNPGQDEPKECVMKVMVTWSVMPGKGPEAVQRFFATQAVPPGLKLLGRMA
jgi:hypothetical protein